MTVKDVNWDFMESALLSGKVEDTGSIWLAGVWFPCAVSSAINVALAINNGICRYRCIELKRSMNSEVIKSHHVTEHRRLRTLLYLYLSTVNKSEPVVPALSKPSALPH